MVQPPEPDRAPPHPHVRVSAVVSWYLRATALLGGLLVFLLAGQRGLVLVPLVLGGFWYIARRSTAGWRVAFGVFGAYLAGELAWWVATAAVGAGGPVVALVALCCGVAVGVLIARAPASADVGGGGVGDRSGTT